MNRSTIAAVVDRLRELEDDPETLARMAMCHTPDDTAGAATWSLGARWLCDLTHELADEIEDGNIDLDDWSGLDRLTHEMADVAVPTSRYGIWFTFVDLGGWDHYTVEDYWRGEDPTEAAGRVLYGIARTLLGVLSRRLKRLNIDLDDDDEEEEE